MSRARRVAQLVQAFGPGWLAFRASYALQVKTGALSRRLPATNWQAQPLRSFLSDPALAAPEAYLAYRREAAPRFFFAPADRAAFAPLLAAYDSGETNPQRSADEIAGGLWPYFEHTPVQSTFPPTWNTNPITGENAPANQHWSRIGDFGCGDIKVIWETSRFGHAYTFVRAYWRTGDEKYAELFWELVDDWRTQNQPQQGPNWKCGQEATFRVMAWCFGLYGTLDSASANAERVAALAEMIGVTGRRIEANIRYALSQSNNHGISEGLGLFTIGALFPEFKDAARWLATGRRVLESEARKLIYKSGAFAQHAVNYHRLMLHDYVWALRLGEILGQPFSTELQELVRGAGEWLYQIEDEISGGAPCYGSNDGALVLPLDNCDYQDLRPTVQMAHYLSAKRRRLENGPWDESLLWLFGPDAAKSARDGGQRADLRDETGGYYVLRSPEGMVFTRCASFRHRPAQADMLHVDLWWRGQNMALDAGTYSYNAPAPWNNALAGTACHNTVLVDDLDQMEQAGKFLWLPWLKGKMRRFERASDGVLAYWEGEHDGYQRLPSPVRHRRAVVYLGHETWLIRDVLSSQTAHNYRLHWLFPDVPHTWDSGAARLSLQTPAGNYYAQCAGTAEAKSDATLVRADENSIRGWRSPYYGHRDPALSLALTQQAENGGFWTLFSPDICEVSWGENVTIAADKWRATLRVSALENEALFTNVRCDGHSELRLT